MYAAARAAKIAVVAGSIIPYNTATADQNHAMRAVNGWIREQADAHAASWSSVTRGRQSPHRAQPDRLVSSPDDLHPSPEGYKLMAAALEPAIVAALAKARSLR